MKIQIRSLLRDERTPLEVAAKEEGCSSARHRGGVIQVGTERWCVVAGEAANAGPFSGVLQAFLPAAEGSKVFTLNLQSFVRLSQP